MEIITAVRGFKDILPTETAKWQYIEKIAREVLANFGFREIRVPILEKTELFKRSIGESTDIVEKEMYTFLDRGDEYLTLRPEATASIVRAYLEHAIYAHDPVARLFTIGPMFRRERPQRGRYRQFHQINAELLGLTDPRTDAEVILMLSRWRLAATRAFPSSMATYMSAAAQISICRAATDGSNALPKRRETIGFAHSVTKNAIGRAK